MKPMTLDELDAFSESIDNLLETFYGLNLTSFVTSLCGRIPGATNVELCLDIEASDLVVHLHQYENSDSDDIVSTHQVRLVLSRPKWEKLKTYLALYSPYQATPSCPKIVLCSTPPLIPNGERKAFDDMYALWCSSTSTARTRTEPPASLSCECGSEKAKLPTHSTWCPRYEP